MARCLRPIPQSGRQSHRFLHAPGSLRARMDFDNIQAKKKAPEGAFFKYGGADGTRTRDPRRDRPVF